MDTLNTHFDFTAPDDMDLDSIEHRIRVVILDGAPWFVAVDVCRVLGITQPSVAYRRLFKGDVRRVERTTLGLAKGAPMVVIAEAGLYALVLRSDKPAAGPFQEWVTREVLPAIRRTGGYRLAGVAPEAVEEGTVAEMPDVGGVMAELRAMRAENNPARLIDSSARGIIPEEEASSGTYMTQNKHI